MKVYYIMAKESLSSPYKFLSGTYKTLTESKNNALFFFENSKAWRCVAMLQETRPEYLFGILQTTTTDKEDTNEEFP